MACSPVHPCPPPRRRPQWLIGVLALALALLSTLAATPAYAQDGEPNGAAADVGGTWLSVGATPAEVSVGEIVTYEIRVRPTSPQEAAALADGFLLLDAIPRPFRPVSGSALATRIDADGRRTIVPTILFGTLDLRLSPADGDAFRIGVGEELRVRYQVVVGSEAEPGRRWNNAARLIAAGSNTELASAVTGVRVTHDAELDLALILGRAFCDDNGNGWLDPGEEGLPGARIYLDNGRYVDTDPAGRYSLIDILPGLHLVKIDTQSLPYGSSLTTRERLAVQLTRGLVTTVDFGVTCARHVVDTPQLLPGEEAWRELQAERRLRTVDGRVHVERGDVVLGDIERALPSLVLAVAEGPNAQPTCVDPAADASGTQDAGDATPEAGSACIAGAWDVAVEEEGEPLPIELVVRTSNLTDAERWALVVSEGETVVWTERGEGPPPGQLRVPARGPDGATVVGPDRQVRVALRVWASGESTATSAPLVLRTAIARPIWSVDRRREGIDATAETLPPDVVAWLRTLAPELRGGQDRPVRVDVHFDDSLEDDALAIARSRAWAQEARRVLAAATGLPAERIVAEGYGSSRPVFPNVSERNRERNRRVLVRVADQDRAIVTEAPVGEERTVARATVDDAALPVEASGEWAGTLTRTESGTYALDVTRGDGTRVSLVLTPSRPELLEGEDQPPLDERARVARTLDEEILARVGTSTASELEVQVPPAQSELGSSSLSVFGRTNPANRIRVGAAEVPVDEDGRFAAVVELPSGESTLVVEAVDARGNRGRVEQPVRVAPRRGFVMAMVDAAVGTQNAEVVGANDSNRLVTDGGVQLYGQTRVYARGWIDGSTVLRGFFREIQGTVQIDTGRRGANEPFARELIQPERLPTLLGDMSETEVQANARGAVFAEIVADQSRAVFGNVRAALDGVGLFRYDRSVYGATVEFNETIAENYHTEIRVHGGDQDQRGRRAWNQLRGTGGSIYYLENRPVVEGSEVLALVVRDRISGTELLRRPLQRNDDYTMRYAEGRILMKSPVPSVVDDAFAIGSYTTTRSLLQGHPVYVEVAYDHRGGPATGERSFGAQARETIHDIVRVGGGVVRETRPGARGYELQSVEAGVGRTETTRLDVEYAWSRNDDAAARFSEDGGLSFGSFRLDDAPATSGDALLVRGRFELADVIDTDRDRIWQTEAWYHRQDRGFSSTGTIFDQGEEKFGVFTRWMPTEHHRLSLRHDNVLATVDNLGARSDLDADPLIRFDRRLTLAQYEYQFNPVSMNLGYQHSFVDDQQVRDGFRTDTVMAGLSYRVVRPLVIGIDQELIARGEDPRLIRGADSTATTRIEDRFVTGISVGLDLSEDITLMASERFRYSGENATAVGLRADVGQGGAVYVQQRMTSWRDNHGTASTTAIGGQQAFGPDGQSRSWAEYQVDNGMLGSRTRAVLGFGRTWTLTEGLTLNAAYERSEVLTGESSASAHQRDAVSASWQLLRFRNLRLSGLVELRFEQAALRSPATGVCLGDDILSLPNFCRDQIRTVGNRHQVVLAHNAVFRAHRDLTFFARHHHIVTENTTLDVLEALETEASFAFAYRPVRHNWGQVLFRYTWLDLVLPYGLETGERRRDGSHVLSFAPVIDTPWRVQWMQKVAWRNRMLRLEAQDPTRNDLLLLVERVNVRVLRDWELGAEYRFLHQSLTQDWQHGTLTELSYLLQEHVRMGVGYNFTRFAEDELGDFDRDHRGVFFRVTAMY